jgi:hypothetical protein
VGTPSKRQMEKTNVQQVYPMHRRSARSFRVSEVALLPQKARMDILWTYYWLFIAFVRIHFFLSTGIIIPTFLSWKVNE